MNQSFYNKENKYSLSKTTVVNATVSVILALITLIFVFIRSSLIESAFSLGSFGFLSVILGLLPYVNFSHAGINNVSKKKLYDPIYENRHEDANLIIANLKLQYRKIGAFYIGFIILLAFIFPWFWPNGSIPTSDNIMNNIPWYEATLFILANVTEALITFGITPIITILLFIYKKNFYSSFLNIFFLLLFNGIIIALLLLQINKQIDLSFINMNIIITFLLASKTLFTLVIAKIYLKKHIPWYRKVKPEVRKIYKNNFISIVNDFFKQIGTDLNAIIFIIFGILTLNVNENVPFHGDHGSGGDLFPTFKAAGEFSLYLLIIVSYSEILHSILDASLPSIAHEYTDERKFSFETFKRYHLGVIFNISFVVISFITLSPFMYSLLANKTTIFLNLTLSIGLIIPFVIEGLSSPYRHLLPILGCFDKILRYSFIKVSTLIISTSIFLLIFCFSFPPEHITSALFLGIIVGWSISSIVEYFLVSNHIKEHIINYERTFFKKNVLIPLIPTFIIYLSVSIVYITNFTNIETINNNNFLALSLSIILPFVTFAFILFNCYFFLKDDFRFYSQNFLLIFKNKDNNKIKKRSKNV